MKYKINTWIFSSFKKHFNHLINAQIWFNHNGKVNEVVSRFRNRESRLMWTINQLGFVLDNITAWRILTGSAAAAKWKTDFFNKTEIQWNETSPQGWNLSVWKLLLMDCTPLSTKKNSSHPSITFKSFVSLKPRGSNFGHFLHLNNC